LGLDVKALHLIVTAHL